MSLAKKLNNWIAKNKQLKIEIKAQKIEHAKQVKEKLDNLLKYNKDIELARIDASMFSGTKKAMCMLINMELSTGNMTSFIIKLHPSNKFVFRNKTYIIDHALKQYHESTGLWSLYYNENMAVPYKNSVDVSRMHKIVTEHGITDVETAFNPLSLRTFLESDVIQKIIQGEELGKFFDFMKMITLINAALAGLNLLMYVLTSGVLKAIKIPGMG